jgi:RND family efflux transporter MFP subunit
MAGVVSALRAMPGAVIAAGDPVLTLSSEQDLEARIDLTEAELAEVGPGTEFLVWRDRNGAGEPVRARVDRVSPVADALTRTRRVYIRLPRGTDGLHLGSLVRARRADASSTELTVPLAAVLDRPEGPAVWTVRRDGQAAAVALQPVITGARVRDRIEVTEGLAQGDEVVIRGVRSLDEGQPVGRRVAP